MSSPTRTVPQGPRRLLARLRMIMAGTGTGQDKLDQTVQAIAEQLAVDVCSLYLLGGDQLLELIATVGLRPEAVRRTRLRLSEGIVGEIAAHAQPLAFSDARAHPGFAYRPETGEEAFSSLAGVPVLRGGNVQGVLAIQTRTRRHFVEEEIETLATIAMVVAEILPRADAERPQVEAEDRRSAGIKRLAGLTLHHGEAIGTVVLHEPSMGVTEMLGEDSEREQARLSRALDALHGSLDRMISADHFSGESREILQAFRAMADDPSWARRIRDTIRQGLSAEAAVKRVLDDSRRRMRQAEGRFARDRLLDIQDLTHRLLLQLARLDRTPDDQRPLPRRIVLVAQSMGPTELLDYPRDQVVALVLEDGSPHSHVAIVARSLDIPVLGQVSDGMSQCKDGAVVIVDATRGHLLLEPGEDLLASYRSRAALRRRQQADLRDLAAQGPLQTRDGVPVTLMANAGLLIDVDTVATLPIAGIGLFRTELPFLLADRYPDVDSQMRLYRDVLDRAMGRPVHFRTFDIGGDKLINGLSRPEPNPALGWRAIRIGLDRPSLLRQQLRALIRAHQGRAMWVFFPLVAEVAELTAARALLDMELAHAQSRGEAVPAAVQVGAMVEVPALLWQLDSLLPLVDFLSIGTNDLLQYMFGADRQNATVSRRYDTLHPGFLSALRNLLQRAGDARVPAVVCGEMAADPLQAMALIGLGARELSVSPHALGPVASLVRSLEVAPVADVLARLITRPVPSVRPMLQSFAQDHGLPVRASS